MGRRNAFVVPNTVRLPLPGDESEWIEVKERLTYGEEQKLATASFTSVKYSQSKADDGDSEIGLDMKRHALHRIHTWVVDWNLEGENGKRVDLSMAAIENLHPDVADEINAVLDEHIKAQEGKAAGKAIAPLSAAK